jgi:hypothetical protein
MIAEASFNDSRTRRAVLRAVESIQSDHDKARVLQRVFEMQDIDPAVIPEIMRVAQSVGSDSDKSHVLEQVQFQSIGPGPASDAYFAAVRTIQSDSDRARVLTGFLGRGGDMSADLLEEICRSAQGIGSDHDKANVLAAARPPLVPTCFAAIRSISSDSDKRRVLERVLTSSASPETARAAVETASSLSSDHDKAEVLICAAQRYRDDETLALIRRVAAGVNSDSDYRRVASQLSGGAR